MSSGKQPEIDSSPPRPGRAGMSDPHAMLDIVMSRRGCSPVLVGRDAEMGTLETALETVRQGEPAAVLIGGEAGRGKTRLIAEFTAAARGAGVRVLTGACLELGADGLPYSPFTAMMRDLVRGAAPDEVAAMLSGRRRAARELARLLPEIATNRSPRDPGRPGEPALTGAEARDAYPGGMTAGEARAHLFEGFLTLLERLPAQPPPGLSNEGPPWGDRSGHG